MPTLKQIIWRLRSSGLKARRWRLLVAIVLALALVGSTLTALLVTDRMHVIDGDTVRFQGRAVRLVGFDTPETGDRARCERERVMGAKATARMRELIRTGAPQLKLVPCACQPGTEGTRACNFGRACGTLTIDGRDAGIILISEGMARPYHCLEHSCPPRTSWC